MFEGQLLLETQVGSLEFSTALLRLFWGHKAQDAVVCNIMQGFSDLQKKCKCPDSPGVLTVPYMPLIELAGVLETHSNGTGHKPY